jgi:hypothetical protein
VRARASSCRRDRIELRPTVLIDEPLSVSVRVILESRAADYGAGEWDYVETVEWMRPPTEGW